MQAFEHQHIDPIKSMSSLALTAAWCQTGGMELAKQNMTDLTDVYIYIYI